MSNANTSTGDHLVLYSVTWDAYSKLLDAFPERRLRHSYNEGTLEIMSPGKSHERIKTLLGHLLMALAVETGVPVQGIGSTTLRKVRKSRGLEPDECYYIAHEAAVRDKDDFDPDRDPPPDLAVEVDVSHSSVDRLPIYAALGIPELWQAGADGLRFLRLNRVGRYVEIPRSIAFPNIAPQMLWKFVEQRSEKNDTAIVREFTAWLRGAAKRKSKS